MSVNVVEIPDKIKIPHQVATLMYMIEERQYNCYVVGDFVRNMLLGEPMGDIDIITGADVDRLESILDNYRIIDINSTQGEIMVMAGGIPVMLRTYRYGKNEDGSIKFGDSLIEDLRGRDFTINTICADLYGNVLDPFDGIDCLTNTPFLLKAVGENEPPIVDEEGREYPYPLSVENNPMYLLKALTLMGSGDYIISGRTADAIRKNCRSIKNLNPIVLRKAFEEILSAKRVSDVFTEFKGVVAAVFPELIPTVDFDQRSLFQNYTLYEHLCKSVGFSFPDIPLRYALLFHGAGKPDCQAVKTDGSATYYGHGERSSIIARSALSRLDAPEELKDEVCFLISHHDIGEIIGETDIIELTEKYGKSELRKLLLLASANIRAKSPENDQKANNVKKLADSLK